MIWDAVHAEDMSHNTIIGGESVGVHLALFRRTIAWSWLIRVAAGPTVLFGSNFAPFNSTIVTVVTFTVLVKGTISTFECRKFCIR